MSSCGTASDGNILAGGLFFEQIFPNADIIESLWKNDDWGRTLIRE